MGTAKGTSIAIELPRHGFQITPPKHRDIRTLQRKGTETLLTLAKLPIFPKPRSWKQQNHF